MRLNLLNAKYYITMKYCGQKVTPFFITITAVLTVTLSIIIFTLSCSGGKIYFKSYFYFVCYTVNDNAVSADSISSAVSNYGGAGYILEYNNAFYVTISCYYNERDAITVCNNLKRMQPNCLVLEVLKEDYAITSFSARSKENLYLGNLNTLLSLSTLAYDCSNSMDKGEFGQNEARLVLNDIENNIKGLLTSNPDNCFSLPLRSVLGECGQAAQGIIYSKNLRKIQIAIADILINLKLY